MPQRKHKLACFEVRKSLFGTNPVEFYKSVPIGTAKTMSHDSRTSIRYEGIMKASKFMLSLNRQLDIQNNHLIL